MQEEAMKHYLLFILLLSIHIQAISQTAAISGRVTDEKDMPVEYATVLLQTSDPEFRQEVTLTDTLGQFRFDREAQAAYCLVVQHVAYYSDTLCYATGLLPEKAICLKEKANWLNEVQVAVRVPVMKIKEDAYLYDARLLRERNIVRNAYELLKEIPGISATSGSLSYGSEPVKVVINGEISSMPASQVLRILRSMPASDVQSIELMHHAPAKYNTHGTVINVKLAGGKTSGRSLSGEAGMTYTQNYYPSVGENLSLSFRKGKLRTDFMGYVEYGKGWGKSENQSCHVLDENRYEISETTLYHNRTFSANTRASLSYAFDSVSHLTLSYYMQHSNGRNHIDSETGYEPEDLLVQSRNRGKDHTWLHHVYAQYTNRDFSVGMEYSRYRNPNDQAYADTLLHQSRNKWQKETGQDIRQYSFFAHHGFTLANGMNFSYGINMGHNSSETTNEYSDENDNNHAADSQTCSYGKQTEYTGNAFLETRHRVSKRLFFTVSAKMEYFKSEYTLNAVRTSLWNDWAFFPSGSLTYSPGRRHNFQLNLSSSKRYPTFWAVTPQVTDVSSYSQITGNPELRPCRSYTGRLTYTLNRQYLLSFFVQYTPDYIMQIPHMDEAELKIIHRYENFDYRLRYGAMLSVPFDIGNRFKSRLTLQGYRTREKMDVFYDASFDHTFYAATVRLNNTWKLASQWQLQINATYNSPNRQGVYRLGESYDMDIRLRWNLLKNAALDCQFSNILCRQMPRPLQIRYGNQYQSGRSYEKSSLLLSFSWQFGKHSFNTYKAVDQSRLGRE